MPWTPAVLIALLAVVAAIIWNLSRIGILDRRLAALEKQRLALVADLEERLYQEGLRWARKAAARPAPSLKNSLFVPI